MKKGLLHGTLALLVIAAVVWWMNRGGEEPPPPEDNRPPTKVVDGATIRGVVGFEGTAPKSSTFTGTPDAVCREHLKDRKTNDDVRIADGKVADAVVYVSAGLETFVPEKRTDTIAIDQQGCLFIPRVTAAQTGQPVIFKNSDPTPHNVQGKGWEKNDSFILPAFNLKGDQERKRFQTPERYELLCNLHAWMKAWLVVRPNSYFAVTGAVGAFQLPPIPAGKYQLTAWHEVLGTATAEVEVKEKEEREVQLIFKK